MALGKSVLLTRLTLRYFFFIELSRQKEKEEKICKFEFSLIFELSHSTVKSLKSLMKTVYKLHAQLSIYLHSTQLIMTAFRLEANVF